MTDKQYDDAILDSNAIDPTDVDGNPIPVTIPIMLAPGVKVVYTTRLGGTSEGDYAHCNLGGKTGDDPNHVLANRVASPTPSMPKLSLVSQVHSGVARRCGRIVRHEPSVRFRRVWRQGRNRSAGGRNRG